MNLPTRSFTDIVRDMSAAITVSTGRLVDMSVGSILRAIIESNAAIVLWVQWLTLLTLQTTRAATSSGQDLDSWMADFSLTRLSAVTASGTATFLRYSGATAAYVPLGTVIKTIDGSVSFTVTSEVSNPTWQPALRSYLMAPGVMAIDLPIAASAAGGSGNVLSNTITILASPVVGIDKINNLAATSGGGDPESDAAFRIRFSGFFATRSRATIDAIGYAVSLVQSGLKFVIQENVDASGNARLGNILIIVDDGSGSISDAMLKSISSSIELVRPVGTTFSVQPAQIVQVQVSFALTLPQGLAASDIRDQLQRALEGYVQSLPIGSSLSITRVSQLVYQTDSRIINISSVLVNSQETDLIPIPTGSLALQSVNIV